MQLKILENEFCQQCSLKSRIKIIGQVFSFFRIYSFDSQRQFFYSALVCFLACWAFKSFLTIRCSSIKKARTTLK